MLLVTALPVGGALADTSTGKNAKVTLVYQHGLPEVPGKSIKGVLAEYGPAGSSPAHMHAKSAFIYAIVLEGAIRSQGPVTVYRAGESFPGIATPSAPTPAKLNRPSSSPCSWWTPTRRN